MTKPKPKKKRCRWRLSYYNASSVVHVCDSCGKGRHSKERPTTAQERRNMKKAWKAKDANVHKVWHAFMKYMGDATGYDAMRKAEKFAKKHPTEIFISGVDDDHFCSSSLVFVVHRAEHSYEGLTGKDTGPKWMGVSCVYIPQCTGEKPVTIFFYPGDMRGTLAVMKELDKRASASPDQKRFASMLRGAAKK